MIKCDKMWQSSLAWRLVSCIYDFWHSQGARWVFLCSFRNMFVGFCSFHRNQDSCTRIRGKAPSTAIIIEFTSIMITYDYV